nr:hypothetical protein [uncultured Campylobacter sp.]
MCIHYIKFDDFAPNYRLTKGGRIETARRDNRFGKKTVERLFRAIFYSIRASIWPRYTVKVGVS